MNVGTAGWFDGEGSISSMMRRIYSLAPAYARAMRAGGSVKETAAKREGEAFGRIGSKITPDEQAAICAAWNSGERCLAEIAASCGVSPPSVARVLAEAGLRSRNGARSGTDRHRSAILALVSAGKSAKEIVAAVGCSDSYVRQVLSNPSRSV